METTETPPATDAIEIASIPARLLAGLIDYFFVTAIYVVASAIVREPDFAGVVTLASSLLYFSLSNSALTQGQSFGKRAFGLRVCALSGGYLSAKNAIVRFFAWLGLIIVCRELPEFIFRHLAYQGDLMVLEAPMLFALSYFLANTVMLAVDPLHRGLHDRAASSIVLRTGAGRYDADSPVASKIIALKGEGLARSLGGLGAGAAIGALLWLLGVQTSPGVAAVARNRYVLEHQLPIRLSGLQEENGTITVDLLIFDSSPGAGKKLAPQILELLTIDGPLPGSTLKLRFYADPATLPADAPPGPEEVSIPLNETPITAK